MSATQPRIPIGRVSQATRLSADTIRFYQRIGLIDVSSRSASGRRLFAQPEIQDLQFIANAQRLGFSLPEIRELLLLRRNVNSCPEVREILKTKLKDICAKIRRLQALKADLKSALKKCDHQVKEPSARDDCPVLNELRGTVTRLP